MQASSQAGGKPRYKVSSPSIYAALTPEHVLHTYRARRLRMFALLVLLAITMKVAFDALVPHHTLGQFVAFTCLALVVIVLVEVSLIMRESALILGILNSDCDPAKLLAVSHLVEERGKLETAVLAPKELKSAYIRCVCLLDLGRTDEARALLPNVKVAGKPAASELMRRELALSLARHDNDVEAIRSGLAQLTALIKSSKPRKALLAQASWNMACAQFDLALGQKDLAAAHKALDQLRSLCWCKTCELLCHYCTARLAEAEGDLAAARASYQLVASMGGTLAIAAEARAWLALGV